MKAFDATLSVWNKFWSFELIEGLVEAGYDVLSVDTIRRRSQAQEYHFAIISAFALMLQSAYRMPKNALGQAVRNILAQCSLATFESYAARYATDARCFWRRNHYD